MLNKTKTILKRAWTYVLRKSEFLRFILWENEPAASRQTDPNGEAPWYDAEWERE